MGRLSNCFVCLQIVFVKCLVHAMLTGLLLFHCHCFKTLLQNVINSCVFSRADGTAINKFSFFCVIKLNVSGNNCGTEITNVF